MYASPASDEPRPPRIQIRSIMLGITLFTLPFYCLGFVIWGISPRGDEGQRIQTVDDTLTETDAPAAASATPIILTATPSSTPLPTRRPPSATPFPIPRQPPTTRPFIPPTTLPATSRPATATDYPLPEKSPTTTRAPLFPATSTPRS